MEIDGIIMKIKNLKSKEEVEDFISSLRFEIRFNTLRELIYHIDIYFAEKNLDKVEELLSIAEQLSSSLKTHGRKNKENIRALKIITQKKRAKLYEAQGNYKKAITQYKLIMSGLRIPEEETFLAEMLMEIGILREEMGKKREALKSFDKSSKIYFRKKHLFNFEASLFNCAHVLYDLKYYYKAEEFCKTVIKTYKLTKKLISPVAHSYLELANIRELFGEMQRAKVYYQKALEYYRKLKHKAKASDILNRLGTFEIREGNLSSAEVILLDALYMKEEIDFAEGKAFFFEVMGDVLRFSGNPQDAINYYNEAYFLSKNVGSSSRNLILTHKIYKVLESLDIAEEDIGTFIENFKPQPPHPMKIIIMKKSEYRKMYGDGYFTKTMNQWYMHKPFTVNRKFLLYVLRNLSKLYRLKNSNQDFIKYSRMREVVEEKYKEENKP